MNNTYSFRILWVLVGVLCLCNKVWSQGINEDKVPQDILYAEYFFGPDPGYGKGTPIPIEKGKEFALDDYEISTQGMPSGDYAFGIRTLGTTGWSPTYMKMVSVINIPDEPLGPVEQAPQDILYAEYFFGPDPGYGKGTPIPIEKGKEFALDDYEISTQGMPSGDYAFGIRTLGTTGWSPTYMKMVSVINIPDAPLGPGEQAPQDILYAEYFFGPDPGYGKGTPIPIEKGKEFALDDYEISTRGMASGDYAFGIRTLGTTGWSPTFMKMVSVINIPDEPLGPGEQAPQDILYAEYFFGTDPGYGKGTPIPIEKGKEFALDDYEISTRGMASGDYAFGIRTLGTTGWSPTYMQIVSVMHVGDNPGYPKETQDILYAEYYWDEDPGYGNGTPIPVAQGKEFSIEDMEIDTNGMKPGTHVFGIRTLGTTGWSPTYAQLVSVMSISPRSIDTHPSQEIVYAEYFIDDDPGYGKGTPISLTPGKELTLDDIDLPNDKDYSLVGIRALGTTGWGPTMIINVDATVYCEDVEAVRVTETTLPIMLDNGNDIGYLTMKLTLPEGVTLATDSEGAFKVSPTQRLNDFAITVNENDDGTYMLKATAAEGRMEITPGEGAILQLTLEVDKGMTSGYYDILLTNIIVGNRQGMSLTRRDTLSVLHVENRLLGDVNDDGFVTVSDPVCLVSWLLGRNPPVFIEEVADFNQDGAITTSDAVAIIRYLLSSAPTPDTPAQDVRRHLTVSVGGADRLDIRLDDAGAYTAFTMDVTLPEGMTLLDASLHALRNSGHDIACHHLGGQQYRIIGFSTTLDTFDGDAPLLTLLTAGTPTGQLRIGNIRFVDTDATERTLAPYAGSATGIESVTTAGDDGPAYRIDGTRTGKVRRGVNILHGKKTANK